MKRLFWGVMICLVATPAVAKHNKRLTPTPPPKECHRFEGRNGYYGNPWCTEEEQLRWDRWDAANTVRLLSGR